MESPKSWGLGGLIVLDDCPDGRKAGTMIWGGLPNLLWFVDRKTGLTGFYATQVVPPGDEKCVDMNSAFVEGIYDMRSSRGHGKVWSSNL